jgi:hypothetical protein
MNFRTFFIVIFLLLPGLLFAQPGDPGGGDPDVPITGIEILLALGGVLGIKRILGLNRNSKKP